MSHAPGDLLPSPRILMGAGPTMTDPRVLRAMAPPLLGQFDPEFTAVMNEVMGLSVGCAGQSLIQERTWAAVKECELYFADVQFDGRVDPARAAADPRADGPGGRRRAGSGSVSSITLPQHAARSIHPVDDLDTARRER